MSSPGDDKTPALRFSAVFSLTVVEFHAAIRQGSCHSILA